MIPLRDSTRSRSFPLLTVILISLNLYIFLRQSLLSQSQLESFIYSYAFIPGLLTERIQNLSIFGFLYPPLITSFFLHGSWFHVIFNMLYLWIFGDNIEDKLGKGRYLLFYFLTGIVANLVQYLSGPASPIPIVGASGAVAGILGAYFITFPRARITSLIFIVFFITIRDIPALYFLLFWFIIQVFNLLSSSGVMGTSVAWWAHIGGFLSGILLMSLLKRRKRWDLT